MMKSLKGLLIINCFVVSLILCSCGSVRNTEYFPDQNDASIPSLNIAPSSTIQPNDILSISVSSPNPSATTIFNSPNNTSNVTIAGVPNQAPGYLVGANGSIQFPLLGEIKVADMTTEAVRKEITRQLIEHKFLIDPIVMVRQLNFKVTVLGEVGHPEVINVPSEKISLLEALGRAGDITIYGRKDNVMVIREESGIKKIKRLNLNSNEIFSSPYYYLKANDVVYVEANKAKVTNSSRGAQLVPIILSGLSFLAIIVEVIIRKN